METIKKAAREADIAVRKVDNTIKNAVLPENVEKQAEREVNIIARQADNQIKNAKNKS